LCQSVGRGDGQNEGIQLEATAFEPARPPVFVQPSSPPTRYTKYERLRKAEGREHHVRSFILFPDRYTEPQAQLTRPCLDPQSQQGAPSLPRHLRSRRTGSPFRPNQIQQAQIPRTCLFLVLFRTSYVQTTRLCPYLPSRYGWQRPTVFSTHWKAENRLPEGNRQTAFGLAFDFG
jgi:hypothetical protein